MRARATAAVLAVAACAGLAGPAAAQDIEALASLRGVRLPDAYYERIRQQPDFFEIRRGWTHRAAAWQADPAAQENGVSGKVGMAVIMALFSDSPEPTVASETTDRQLFGTNPAGNLTQFYQELSGGRLTMHGQVLPWVRTGVTRATAVGTSMGLGGDARLGDYLVDALTQLDPSVDFGQFDNDGPDGVPNSRDDDGFVDAAVFQFAERAAACGGSGPWPHRSVIQNWTNGVPFTTNDRRPGGGFVRVDDYIIQGAVDCEGQPQSISVIAHEMGHILGLPDFYDATGGLLPAQRRWVMGCFSLMAAGAWGCGDGSTFATAPTPAHMGPYEKGRLGWIQEETATEGEYVLQPVQTSARSLRIPLNGESEYLQLEYRPNTGFNASLPVGGVLVYHVDGTIPFRPCATCPRIYRVMLLEADGNSGLVRTATEGGDRGVASDVFTGTRTLTDQGTPNLRRHNGALSDLVVRITVEGGQARVLVARVPSIAVERLVAPFLGTQAAPLTPEEETRMDAQGNGNGRYDLGDLRAYLRTHPAAADALPPGFIP